MEPIQNDVTVHLADDSDLVLVVSNNDGSKVRSFHVLSDILCLASQYFGKLLSPNFEEGKRLREAQKQGSQFVMTLKEDDMEAMDFIFSYVHFKAERTRENLTAEGIANIAIQSDKYDFNAALMPWINYWCNANTFPLENGARVRDMGYEAEENEEDEEDED
ncbi:hypothetical protein VTK56DRAFT_4229 [Thermocarpiscus australiensis]